MKGLLRGVGFFLIIGSIVIYLCASYLQKDAEPREVRFGVVTSGQFLETGSGKIGGSHQAVREFKALKVIAVLGGLCGTGLCIGSVVIKTDSKVDY